MLGLLDDSDNGKMDLGTLEKRLSEQKNSSRRTSMAVSNHTSPAQSTSGPDGNAESPKSTLTSPEPQKEQLPRKKDANPSEKTGKEKEEEVEALSDMMCSLVTNNCGETRYIGRCSCSRAGMRGLPIFRLFFWFLYLLAEGYTVGERKNRRFIFPADDNFRCSG